MCASSRMVVRRRDAARPAVVACTLLPYAPESNSARPSPRRPARLGRCERLMLHGRVIGCQAVTGIY